MDTNKEESVLMASEWSALPFIIRRKVVSYLPIVDRVKLERVNSEFLEISNELFAKQKKIGYVCYGYEDPYSYPQAKIMIRCPNLESHVFAYDDIPPEDADNLIKLYNYCPKIRRLVFGNRHQLVYVMAYILSYRSSDAYIPGSFSLSYVADDNPDIHDVIFRALEYRTFMIEFPDKFSEVNLDYVRYQLHLDQLNLKDIESLKFTTCNYDYEPTDEYYSDVERQNKSVDKYNYILSGLIDRPYWKDQDGDDPNAEYVSNLKEIYGPIDQDNFDVICNRCPNIRTIRIDDAMNGINILNLLNCQNISWLQIDPFEDFDAEELDVENRSAMIEFLSLRGHLLKRLRLSIADPVDPLLDAITQNCPHLTYLCLDIQRKGSLVQLIPRLKKLKDLRVFGIKLTVADVNYIANNIKRLERFQYKCEDLEDANGHNPMRMIGKYLPRVVMIGACLSMLYNLLKHRNTT